MNKATLTYMGHSSLKIITPEQRVIYIDPYAGDDYTDSADAILVTHEHFDHNELSKISHMHKDCKIIRSEHALAGGVHNVFDFGWVHIEAVEAGYNTYHDVSECVGYVVTLTNGKTIYISGDTSTTTHMTDGTLAQKHLDYAFWCCDGDYNMDIVEAVLAANMVGAACNIPYHIVSTDTGRTFDADRAARFNAHNARIIEPGETIIL